MSNFNFWTFSLIIGIVIGVTFGCEKADNTNVHQTSSPMFIISKGTTRLGPPFYEISDGINRWTLWTTNNYNIGDEVTIVVKPRIVR